MSAKHRVSQIILLFGYRYRLHQVILGIQGESSCCNHHMAGINNIARIKKYGDIKEIKRA